MLNLECIICGSQANDLYTGEPCCYNKDCVQTIDEARGGV